MKALAVIEECRDHERGYCFMCDYNSGTVATCPVHGNRLMPSGYCGNCRAYYDRPKAEAERAADLKGA